MLARPSGAFGRREAIFLFRNIFGYLNRVLADGAKTRRKLSGSVDVLHTLSVSQVTGGDRSRPRSAEKSAIHGMRGPTIAPAAVRTHCALAGLNSPASAETGTRRWFLRPGLTQAEPMSDAIELLKRLYGFFNARDMEALLAFMHEDVNLGERHGRRVMSTAVMGYVIIGRDSGL